jgi:hypothetical protein
MASLPATVNASCGTNRTTYAASVSSWPSVSTSAFCASGTLVGGTPTFPVPGGNTTWSCNGLNGGVNASCTAFVSAPVPDLLAQNSSPAASASFSLANPITFTGTAVNNSAASISQNVWADLEVDWDSDGSFTNYNAASGVRLGSFTAWATKPLSYTFAAGATPAGTHRYRFNVDVANELSEGDEANNRSGWTTFTVAPSPAVSLNTTGCTIVSGSNQCQGSATWSFTNILSPQNYNVQNNTTGNAISSSVSGSNVTITLPYGINQIRATANGVSSTKDTFATCASGTSWNSVTAKCESVAAQPTVSLVSTPGLVRNGETSKVRAIINSSLVLNCTITSVQGGDKTFVHNGPVKANEVYVFETQPVTSARDVVLQCTYGAGQVIESKTRISSVPTFEEV